MKTNKIKAWSKFLKGFVQVVEIHGVANSVVLHMLHATKST